VVFLARDLKHKRLVEWGLASLINLRADPLLAALRADPGYPGLLRRLAMESP
jgi:hypothetical protein